MKIVRGFGRFWWDFLVGDDWTNGWLPSWAPRSFSLSSSASPSTFDAAEARRLSAPTSFPIIDDGAIPHDLAREARRAVSSCPRLALFLEQRADAETAGRMT